MNILIGFAAGVCASMGLGGGFILIVYLLLMGFSQSAAGGVNLLFFLPVSATSAFLHLRGGMADLRRVVPLCLWGAVGVAIANFAVRIFGVPDAGLRKTFAALLVLYGILELRESWKK